VDEKQRLFIRGLCERSFWHFLNFCIIPYRVPAYKRQKLPEKIHKRLCDFSQDDSVKRKGVLMPRGFGKSFCITESKPIWDYIRNHDERILVVHEIIARAKKFVAVIKDNIDNNPYLHHFFPETKLPERWTSDHGWSSEGLYMPRGGVYKDPTFSPLGVGGANQGLRISRLYIDDMIGDAAVTSLVERMNTEFWFSGIPDILEFQDHTHPLASHIFIIGTHYGFGDIYHKIQQSDKSYIWMKIKAMDDHGRATWPEWLSIEKINEMKADPERVMRFYTQYQNDPMETELQDFKMEWLKYHRRVVDKDGGLCVEYTVKTKKDGEFSEELRTILVADLEISATIDPAVSESGTKKTARTAIIIVGVDKHNKKHVLEAWAKKTNKNEDLYDKVFEFHQKYRPRRWGIETFAQQNFILRAIRDEAQLRRVFLPISELPKDVGHNAKDIRIRSLQDDFVGGDVLIHESMADFVSEYLAFPMGPTKDLMDALSYHKQWWTKAQKEDIKDDQEYRFQQYIQSRATPW